MNEELEAMQALLDGMKKANSAGMLLLDGKDNEEYVRQLDLYAHYQTTLVILLGGDPERAKRIKEKS